VNMSAEVAADKGDRCVSTLPGALPLAPAQAEAALLGFTGLRNLGDQRAKTSGSYLGRDFLAGEMASGSASVQVVAGLAAIVLGILAVAGTSSTAVTLAALLVLGVTIILTGSTLSGLVLGLMRPVRRQPKDLSCPPEEKTIDQRRPPVTARRWAARVRQIFRHHGVDCVGISSDFLALRSPLLGRDHLVPYSANGFSQIRILKIRKQRECLKIQNRDGLSVDLDELVSAQRTKRAIYVDGR
jgi:hypothetical protein